MNVTAYGIPETLRLTSNTRYQGKSLKDISGLISPLPCKVSFEKRWDRRETLQTAASFLPCSRADGTLTCCIYHLQTFSSHRERYCTSALLWIICHITYSEKKPSIWTWIHVTAALLSRPRPRTTGLLFTCALPLSCDRCCLLQYCLHSPGLFLRDWPTSPENVSQGDGVWGYNHATQTRQSATLHAATLPVSAAGHRSPRKRPQDCVCLWQERKKKKKVLLWGNIYLSLPLSISSLSSFLSPESVQSKHL